MAEVSSQNLLGSVTYYNGINNATYNGTFYIDETNKILYLELPDGSNPTSDTVEVASTEGPLLNNNGQSDVTVNGITFMHGANPAQTGLVTFKYGANCMIENCNVYYAAAAGATFSSATGFQAQNCVFQWNGEEGFTNSHLVNAKFLDCNTSYNNLLPNKQYAPGFEAGGFKFVLTTGTTLNGHTSTGNYGPGIWFDISNQGATIENCVSYGNSTGLQYEISYTGTIENNECFNNTGNGIYISSSAGCTLADNICFGNGIYGIASEGSARNDGDPNGYTVESYANSMWGNIVAFNETDPNTRSYGVDISTPTSSSVTNTLVPLGPSSSDHNLFFIPSTSPQETSFAAQTDAGGDTFAATLGGSGGWQAISGGLDLNSVRCDPHFDNYIINEQFTDDVANAPLAGRKPDATNLPGASWVSTGSNNLDASGGSSALQTVFAATGKIKLINGSFALNDVLLNVTGRVCLHTLSGGTNPGIFLGFSSGTKFYGVILGQPASGTSYPTISLQQGSSITALTYDTSEIGTYSASDYYTLSYTINTITGEVLNIVLDGPYGTASVTPPSTGFGTVNSTSVGSNGKITLNTPSGFAGGNLTYAAFYTSGTSGLGYIDNFAVRSSSNFTLPEEVNTSNDTMPANEEPGPATTVIVDNQTTDSIAVTGNWSASTSVGGYYGNSYVYEGGSDNDKTFTFLPNLSAEADYLIYGCWTASGDRASNAQIDIHHADGSVSTVTANQQTNGGKWNLLGGYSHGVGNASAEVTIRDTGANGTVIANAMAFVPGSTSGATIVDVANTAQVTTTGTWTSNTSESGYYGPNYLTDGDAQGGQSVSFAATLPSTGDYLVYAWWPIGTTGSTVVPISIASNGTTVGNVTVNQLNNGGIWVLLGAYTFSSTNASVTISDTGANGTVVANAVQFVPAASVLPSLTVPQPAPATDTPALPPLGYIIFAALLLAIGVKSAAQKVDS